MASQEEMIPVNIVVADRSYRLRIKAEDEESIRKKMKEVNKKIVEFKTSFAGKDLQDYISMCLIWYATQNQEESNGKKEEAELAPLLKNLETEIDQILKETE